MFRPGNRMGRHEADAGRQVRGNSCNHRALHGSHVGDNAARLEMASDGLGNGSVGADGHAEDDEIGVAHGECGVRLDPVGKAEFRDAGTYGSGIVRRDDFASDPLAPNCPGDGGSDQPEADNSDSLENGSLKGGAKLGGHLAYSLPAMKSASA